MKNVSLEEIKKKYQNCKIGENITYYIGENMSYQKRCEKNVKHFLWDERQSGNITFCQEKTHNGKKNIYRYFFQRIKSSRR